MKIHQIGQKKEYHVVAVEGRMDAVSAPEFEKSLNALIAEGALKIIVDFENLDYISSAGLHLWMQHLKPLERNQISAFKS